MKVICAAVMALAMCLVGCNSSTDDSPTNTKNSQYVGGGKSAADQIGAQRAHRRLPNGGKGQQ